MKLFKTLQILILSLLLAFCACSCEENLQKSENGKIKVVTTLFPQYDFASTIGAGRAEVVKLLPWGAESHTYDPSVGDIAKIADADMFIYTGKDMEKWAAAILENAGNESVLVVDLSQNITLLEGTQNHADERGNNHTHDYDAHVWTSPDNAKIMVDDILSAYCDLDSENADYYRSNANALKSEIDALSKRLKELSESYDGRTLWFGGRFAFRYMFEQYGFSYRSPYLGCGEEAEPSIKTVTDIISQMKDSGAEYIFFEEMSDGKIAKSIAEETGAELLLLHSCHNLSKDEAKAGESYISIMRKNIENLALAIGEKG